LIHCCRDVFTAHVRNNERGAVHIERRLQHLFYCCMTSQRTWRVPLLRMYGPLPNNGCFSVWTVFALIKNATMLIVQSFMRPIHIRVFEQFEYHNLILNNFMRIYLFLSKSLLLHYCICNCFFRTGLFTLTILLCLLGMFSWTTLTGWS
jgi:hypothetical protein